MKKQYFNSLACIFFVLCFLHPHFDLISQEMALEDSTISVRKTSNLYDNSVGVKYSNFSGYGIVYSRRLFDDYVISISGVAIYYEFQKWKDMSKEQLVEDQHDVIMNFGLELQRNLFVSNNTRVYMLLGGQFINDDNRQMDDGSKKIIYSAAFGFGFEWFVEEQISFYLNMGYKYDEISKEEYLQPSLERKTGIGFGIGFVYHF